MITRIIIGTIIGALLGAILEYVNGFFTYMLPPLFVIMPLCVLMEAGIGAVSSFTQSKNTHADI